MTKRIAADTENTILTEAPQLNNISIASEKKSGAKKTASSHKLQLSEEIIKYAELYNLSRREAEVLTEIFKGLAIREIAEELYITERTVKYHISNILSKTGCKNQRTLLIKLKCRE